MALRLTCALVPLVVSLPAQLPPQGLADRSLEELMNIEVTSVSKKAQRFVITAEDIRRSGLGLPEVLRLAPGLDLTRKVQFDAAVYYVSALPEINVPSHFRLDVRLGWRPVERLELSIGVKDALDPEHPEGYSQRLTGLEAVPRDVYGKATWRF